MKNLSFQKRLELELQAAKNSLARTEADINQHRDNMLKACSNRFDITTDERLRCVISDRKHMAYARVKKDCLIERIYMLTDMLHHTGEEQTDPTDTCQYGYLDKKLSILQNIYADSDYDTEEYTLNMLRTDMLQETVKLCSDLENAYRKEIMEKSRQDCPVPFCNDMRNPFA